MKTAREWFETFPEPDRSQALENLHISNKIYKYASEALIDIDSFVWGDSPQKFEYWDKFHNKLLSENK